MIPVRLRSVYRPAMVSASARVVVSELGEDPLWGGFATHAVAPREAVHAIPGALSFDQAAGLLGSYETAYHCLVARGRLQAGETVLVHGASGSTGLAAVHIARLLVILAVWSVSRWHRGCPCRPRPHRG